MVRRKNRLTTDALREVRNTFSRFLSILVLSALAVAFLAGLRATAPDMEYTADNYYDRVHMMDGYVLSTLGLTDEDLTVLAQAEGVEQVEGGYSIDATAVDSIVTVRSMPAELNLPEVDRGRLPERADECVTEGLLLVALGLDLGDRLELTLEEDEEGLTRTSYTIVGTVNSPLYVGTDRGTSSLGNGSVDAFVYVPAENFDMDVYTVAYYTGTGLAELDSYGDEYEERADALADSLDGLAREREQLRYDSVVGDAQAELDEARRELDDAKAEADQELADAWQELQDARQELDDGWQKYYDGVQELDDATAEASREIADAQQELADALTELNDAEQELADARQELDDGWQKYEDGLAEYQDAQAKYEDGLAQYQSGAAQVSAGWSQYNSGAAELESRIAATTQAQAELATAQAAEQAVAANDAQIQAEAAQAARAALLAAGLTEGTPAYEAAYPSACSQAYAAARAAAYEQAYAAAYDTVYEQVHALVLASDEVQAANAQLNSAAAQLNAAGQELNTARAELDDAWAQLEEARIELEDALAQLEDGEREYTAGQAELADGWQEYNDGLADLADARATLKRETADARQELDDALVKLEDGEAEYADGLQEYEEGKAEAETEIADAEKKLADAQAELDEIDDCKWYVLSRYTNNGFVSYSQDAERVGNLAKVFPVIFFLVAALACLTTMTRMVEEQRTQIGALKAMGFSRLAISKKYIGYAFFASLLGGVLGLAAGCTTIPLVIANAFNIMYNIPPLEFKGQTLLCVAAVMAAVLCTTGAAVWACQSTLTDTPANLMRPKAPKAGRRVFLERIGPIWRRLSFTWKVTVRNLFRYQRRFWMTVIGIGGCTALIVTGFGLHDSIFDILDKQFDEISRYDATVGLEENISAEKLTRVEDYLKEDPGVERYLHCHQSSAEVSGDGAAHSAYLFVVDDGETFRQFIDLRHRQDDQAVELSAEGVVITEKLSELLDVTVGDTITIDGDKRVDAVVTDIVENYVYHYVYLDSALYGQLFGEPADNNVLLLSFADGTQAEDSDRTSETLMKMDGVASYSYIATIRDSFTDSMSAINYAVIIIILAAAALAFVVLYNLTNINITERTRELATLKVLGFYDRETSAYIYRENIFLTLFGILLGLVMGRFLHGWMVLTVEVDIVMFGRTAPPYAYLLAACLTAVFSVIVNIAAHFRLKKVDMVESLKTVE